MTTPNAPETTRPQPAPTGWKKAWLLGLVLLMAVACFIAVRQYFDIAYLASFEQQLKSFYVSNPVIVLAAAFVIYALVTGLSVPGASPMTLVMAWFLGFPTALVLISFASTTGATIAFLISRHLFRDWIESRFGDRLEKFNEALEKEGAFYLFTLRLIPLVPFFVINNVMGLTKIPTRTFWWVSQLGMLAGTAIYCYAGSRIPDLQALSEHGIGSVLNRQQLTQITIALVLLSLFPIAAKKIIAVLRTKPA